MGSIGAQKIPGGGTIARGLPEELREPLPTTPTNSFKVSIGGVLPNDMEADSEKDIVRLFNEANADSSGIGYKVRSAGTEYEIIQTFRGRAVPRNVTIPKRVYLYKKSNGRWAFGD